MKLYISDKIVVTLFVFIMLIIAAPIQAKVTVKEAERLKNDLTPTGAIRAGNADGTIPAWEGGLSSVPTNVNYDINNPPADGRFPDPFDDDKILFTITAQNMDQYTDKLSPGIIAMMKKYPDTFKMDVYPSRRTFAAPQWVYDNTYDCALSFGLTEDGNGARGGIGGIPFPIPKRGAEVVINHLSKWTGGDRGEISFGTVVQGDGSYIRNNTRSEFSYPYWDRNATLENWNGFVWNVLIYFYYPPRRAGEILLSKSPFDYTKYPDKASWQYMPGQRRVRRAPSIAYDTPNPSFGGYATYDDAYMFNGQIDRYNWSLIGLKETFIPYNSYKHDLAPLDDLIMAHHWNPKYVRWELHRTWVVEATLKEGKRHCYGKRVLYIDEDSWSASIHDKYDMRGNLWRTAITSQYCNYAIPAWVPRGYALYDLQSETYATSSISNGYNEGPVLWWKEIDDDSVMTPAYIRKLGTR